MDEYVKLPVVFSFRPLPLSHLIILSCSPDLVLLLTCVVRPRPIHPRLGKSLSKRSSFDFKLPT